MLTLIGTGHVFKIGETVSFLVRQAWPDAVCVELDDFRLHILTGDKEAIRKDLKARGIDPDASREERMKNASPVFRQSAKYQEKVSEKNRSQAGADMVAAIGAAKSVDAKIYCIDFDAQQSLQKMWDQMSRRERLRYRMSGHLDNLFKKRRVDKTQKDYTKDQEAYVENMRKRYPTLVKVLIDERNEHMSKEISKVCSQYERVVAVVGDAHVDGLLKLLPPDLKVRTVRLWELMDSEQAMKLKSEFWESD